MSKIYERLDRLVERLNDKSFRENKGLGNEVGFHIFDYDPEDELIVRNRIKNIINKSKKLDYDIEEFDLFDILIKNMSEEGMDIFFDIEKEGRHELFDAVKEITESGETIVKHIKENHTEGSYVFITGVGKVWPIIRSHTILNKLHAVIEDAPLILFFPGVYDGQSLILFNLFNDSHYYRAFRLIER